jgi:hypothetical protein
MSCCGLNIYLICSDCGFRELFAGCRSVMWAHWRGLGVVNLLPVDRINEHDGARRPGSSVLCGSGKVRDVLPGVESAP